MPWPLVQFQPPLPFFMQTFLPFEDFQASACVLDRMRLGKQRVECKQILQALKNGPYQVGEDGIRKTPWYNHPATKMWMGHEQALIRYSIEVCERWIGLGYSDSLLPHFKSLWKRRVAYPKWLGNSDFHRSHRSNLLRKNPNYYKSCGWEEPDNLPYVWPLP